MGPWANHFLSLNHKMRTPGPPHTSTLRFSPPEGFRMKRWRDVNKVASHTCLGSPLPSLPSHAPKPILKGGRNTDQSIQGPPQNSIGWPKAQHMTASPPGPASRSPKSSCSHGHGAGSLSANCWWDRQCFITLRDRSINADSVCAPHASKPAGSTREGSG